ncbi:hypothetical protein B0A78_08435 [Flavobacterium columnare NBRC 100251 = ATCC 23463]|nr:hypothetical protein BU993_05515 [Flavobacterium columnare]MBF6657297.1 hypothetical protein [Flavobacterium columnare]OOB82225.1 hypothetical protein BZL53_10420 [Flavobacterium columnare]PDS23814.1 hypothetical protein B0A78_08435 [Flavobacterium columnare NBRC 100251 = ATCC 23463]PTD14260.1 hypothetical protein C6N29_07355 [Flavobacterium columnare]
MKKSTFKFTSLLFISFILYSFQDPFLVKRVSDKDFRYEFFTTNKKKKPKINKDYFWFKGGLIHNSQYGIGGELLDGKFSKFYHSNQLAEQGTFKKGLKTKEWKSWHPNGKIAFIYHWSSGLKHGEYFSFDTEGKMIERGFYKNDLKSKIWIHFERKDTLIYKEGKIVVPKKPKNTIQKTSDTYTKTSFFKRLFRKKNKTHDAQGA